MDLITRYLKLASDEYYFPPCGSYGYWGVHIDVEFMPESTIDWIDNISKIYNKGDTHGENAGKKFNALGIHKNCGLYDDYIIGLMMYHDNSGGYATSESMVSDIPNINLLQVEQLLIFLNDRGFLINNKNESVVVSLEYQILNEDEKIDYREELFNKMRLEYYSKKK